MQNYSRLAREPDCFEHQRPRREHLARIARRVHVNPGVARVGMGPILRIGKNQKAPAMYRPSNRSNDDATFIVLQERDDFCGVRVVPIGI
jgi:hypothetical protein